MQVTEHFSIINLNKISIIFDKSRLFLAYYSIRHYILFHFIFKIMAAFAEFWVLILLTKQRHARTAD